MRREVTALTNGFREAVMPKSPLRHYMTPAGLQTCFYKCPEATTQPIIYDVMNELENSED